MCSNTSNVVLQWCNTEQKNKILIVIGPRRYRQQHLQSESARCLQYRDVCAFCEERVQTCIFHSDMNSTANDKYLEGSSSDSATVSTASSSRLAHTGQLQRLHGHSIFARSTDIRDVTHTSCTPVTESRQDLVSPTSVIYMAVLPPDTGHWQTQTASCLSLETSIWRARRASCF